MIYWAAFVLGVFSSIHCIGMCGPIALATPVIKKSYFTEMFSRVLYNSGRTFSYMGIGFIAGSLGSVFVLSGIQQWVSVGTGVVILIWVILPKTNPENWNFIQKMKFVKLIRKKIGFLFKKKAYSSIFLIGVLNGFLPCGMVYMAIVSALAASNYWEGGMYLMFFGLGTWPLMFIITSTWALVNQNFRRRSRQILPYFIGFIAIMLIVRGAGQSSPSLEENKSSVTICK